MSFLKWMGSKSRYLKYLTPHLPTAFKSTYYEPFLGSGSLYFYLKSAGFINSAVITDSNLDLISAYIGLADPLRRSFIIQMLNQHRVNHCKKYYNYLRGISPVSIEARAARFLYFNRTGVSGIWRENASGRYNTPCKKETISWLPDEKYTISGRILEHKTQINYGDYLNYTSSCLPGDFVYFDPPYLEFALDKQSGYTRAKFGVDAHIELKAEVDRLTALGVYVMLSNSSDDISVEMYGDYEQHRYPVVYNTIGGRSVQKEDLLVVNY
jgi:DNA adenine methylase